MINNDYWDRDEYEFFNELEDSDKLLYIYDLMLAEIDEPLWGGDDIDSDIWDELEREVGNSPEVSSSKGIRITAKTLDDIQSIADLMMMNGAMLTDSNLTITKENVIMTYILLGKCNAISVN